MSHLDTTLRRAIADLDPADRDGRRIALGNVRAAMVRLLAVYDPPLSADAIEAKIDEVDGLIRAIEAEFAPPAPRRAAVAALPEDARQLGALPEDASPPALPPEPLAPPAESDFDDEYEAGDEAYPDEAYDEGHYDAEPYADEFADDPAEDEALDEDVVPDVADDQDARPRTTSAKPLVLLGGALVVLLAVLLGALYVTGPRFGSSAQQAVADAGTPAVPDPSSPAAAAGTDALEATDVAPDPAPATPAPEAPATGPLPAAEPGTAAPVTAPTAPAPIPPAAAPTAPAGQSIAPPPGPAAAETFVLFDGHDPSAFKSAPDNPVQFQGGTDGGSVRISSSAGSNGARLIVGPGVYQPIAGRQIRVVVVARGAAGSPASSLRLAYQNGRQLSGWSDLKLTDAYQSLAMTWTMPKQRQGTEGDAVLIEPGIPGDQTAADIRSVSIDVLP